MSTKTPLPPTNLRRGGRGRGLWREITSVLDLDGRDLALLTETARCVDQLDQLDALAARDGPLTPDGRVNPVIIEARQQRVALARLIAALRLPEDLSQPDRRPQHRGVRGVYGGLRAVGE